MDRPIIFSAPMVRALLAARKTQTRRLATSPLRKCEVGDRLWVRQEWRTDVSLDHVKPRDLDGAATPFWFDAEAAWQVPTLPPIDGAPGRRRPGMHMPRWASRLTLIVEGVKVEPLQAISEADAAAEGAHLLGAAERHEHRGNRRWVLGHCRECAGWDPATMRKTITCPYRLGDERDHRDHNGAGCSTSFRLRTTPEPARFQFENLWGSLHYSPGETWRDNPDVVALTFRVVAGNIDRITA